MPRKNTRAVAKALKGKQPCAGCLLCTGRARDPKHTTTANLGWRRSPLRLFVC